MAYQTEGWNLNDLLNKKDIPAILRKLETLTKKIESYKPIFNKNISEKKFRELFGIIEELNVLSLDLSKYTSLWFFENTKNQDAAALKSKIEQVDAEISNRLVWVGLRFVDFPKKDIGRLIKSCPHIKYYLEQIVKHKKHKLNENEEKIINIKDKNGLSIVDKIYDLISSDMEFEFMGKKVTQEELRKEAKNPNAKIRELVYRTLSTKYSKYEDVLGEIYKAIVSDWNEEYINLRKYDSPLSVRNKSQDISDRTVETLINVCQKNQNVFQKFFRLKASKLKTKKLKRTDLYAPLKKTEDKLTYDEAVNIVLKSFKFFSKEFYNEAKNMVDKKHIHSKIQKGKLGGAFCEFTSSRNYPYVLINFTDDYKSASALAHELGHAIHVILANRKQNIFNAYAVLPIAETASIFSELLLIQNIKNKNPKIAKELTFEQLENIYATIGRQIEFVAFEKDAHELIKNSPTIKDINTLYLTRLKKHFGKDVIVPDYFQYEWLQIPHIFHTPFYCYAYAFGSLLSLAIYSAYLENPNVKDKFIKFLSDGSSKSPKDLVKELGFNIEDEKFWQRGFNQIERMIQEVS